MADNDSLAADGRERRLSQATTSSLAFVDPAPIETPEVDDVEKQLTSEDGVLNGSGTNHTDNTAPRTGSTTAPGLSGSGRGAVYYCEFGSPRLP